MTESKASEFAKWPGEIRILRILSFLYPRADGGASLPTTGGTGAPTPTARARTRRSTGPSSARRELQPVESSISQASDHHASPDAAAPLAPDETASSEEPTTENLSELLLPAGIFNNIFTCADVTEAISNYLLENHSELAGSLESALEELREQVVGIDVEAQGVCHLLWCGVARWVMVVIEPKPCSVAQAGGPMRQRR